MAPVARTSPASVSVMEVIHMTIHKNPTGPSIAMPYIWLRTVARSWRMSARDLYSRIP